MTDAEGPLRQPSAAALPRFSPRRQLGRTGFVATQIGIGDLADRKVPLETCVATLRRALDAGLNLVDTAPNYEDGYSEQIVGAALAGRRAGVFLIDKVDHLDRPVRPQVEESLGRLGVPVDLFVFHSVSSLEAYQQLVTPNGAWQELEACRNDGRCRFIGLSSHDPRVLRAALERGGADVLMFPVGPFVDARYTDEILPLAKQRGVGSVCFKTFGAGKLLGDVSGYGQPLAERPRGKRSSGGVEEPGAPLLPRLSVEECVAYTLTQDPDVALLGMSFPNEQDAALQAAARARPLSSAQLSEVRGRAARAVEGKGACWWNPAPSV